MAKLIDLAIVLVLAVAAPVYAQDDFYITDFMPTQSSLAGGTTCAPWCLGAPGLTWSGFS